MEPASGRYQGMAGPWKAWEVASLDDPEGYGGFKWRNKVWLCIQHAQKLGWTVECRQRPWDKDRLWNFRAYRDADETEEYSTCPDFCKRFMPGVKTC